MQNHTARDTAAIILAAGKGTRMKSDMPKVLHPLLGKPLVTYVTKAVQEAGIESIFLVIGYKAGEVKQTLGKKYNYVLQKKQLGTGHAVMTAAKALDNFKGDVLVIVGDAPFLTPDVLQRLVRRHQKTGASATMMTAVIDPPPPYGRIVRDRQNRVLRIVEDRDATAREKRICEVNTSHYCFRSEDVFPLLYELNTDNDQGEYYLTDIIELLSDRNKPVETLPEENPDILKGINSQADLRSAVQKIKSDTIAHHMEGGVFIPDPDLVYIEPDVAIGPRTVIHPYSYIAGSSKIGSDCEIGPFVTIKNAAVNNNCRIHNTVVTDKTDTASG